MAYQLVPIDNPTAPSLTVSARLRSQLVYFMTPPDEPHVPPLQPNDYWIDAAHSAQWIGQLAPIRIPVPRGPRTARRAARARPAPRP